MDVLPQDLVKSRMSRDSGSNISNRSEIWQAPRQSCCRDACQMSERYDRYNIQSRGFETSRDLAVRGPGFFLFLQYDFDTVKQFEGCKYRIRFDLSNVGQSREDLASSSDQLASASDVDFRTQEGVKVSLKTPRVINIDGDAWAISGEWLQVKWVSF